jgi:hypothetical protein
MQSSVAAEDPVVTESCQILFWLHVLRGAVLGTAERRGISDFRAVQYSVDASGCTGYLQGKTGPAQGSKRRAGSVSTSVAIVPRLESFRSSLALMRPTYVLRAGLHRNRKLGVTVR